MANQNNDHKIMELKSQIVSKREELKKQNKRFVPLTNCIIDFEGIKSNLQVLTKEQLTILLIKLNLYLISARDLNLSEPIVINGYALDEWIIDIRRKLEIIKYKEEENKLKSMENKLHKLLSVDKKTEIELDEIASLLN